MTVDEFRDLCFKAIAKNDKCTYIDFDAGKIESQLQKTCKEKIVGLLLEIEDYYKLLTDKNFFTYFVQKEFIQKPSRYERITRGYEFVGKACGSLEVFVLYANNVSKNYLTAKDISNITNLTQI